MALMVWKCIHGVAPAYLIIPATAMSGRQNMQSVSSQTLLVLYMQIAVGQQSFTVNGLTMHYEH